MKKMNGFARAYYTLEAALILPLIFLLTAALIYLGFMLHDRLVLKSLTASYAEDAAYAAGAPADGEGRLDPERFAASFSGPLEGGLSPEEAAAASAALKKEAEGRTLIFMTAEACVCQEGREIVAFVRGSFPVKAVRLVTGSTEEETAEARREIPLKAGELIRIVRGIWKNEE